MSLASISMQVFPSVEFMHSRGTSPSLRDTLGRLGGDRLVNEFSPRHKQWSDIVKHVNKHGLIGLMLTTKAKNRWGFITRDCADSHQFRYTTFDRCGFLGHGTYATAEEACIALFDMGFRVIDDPNRLDEIASSCKWYVE